MIQDTNLEDLQTINGRLPLRQKRHIVMFCDAVLLHRQLYLAFFPKKLDFSKVVFPTLFHVKYVLLNLKEIDDAINKKLEASLPLTRLTYLNLMVNEGDFLHVLKWGKLETVERLYFECSWVVRAHP